ncbi:MAG: TldD/PmbA family protein [Planctomycetota bacterium]|nr:TldD/PmbA family protein [Planctomycetota bacterium]
MSELLELARRACREAIKHGAEMADVELSRRRGVSVNVEKNGIHDAKETSTASVSVRSIVKGATGFSTSSGFGVKDVLETARRSAAAAKLAQPDPDFVTLPGPASCREVPGLYDKGLAALTAADLIRLLAAEIDAAREVCSDVMVQGGASLGEWERALANSLGVAVADKGTSADLFVFCIVKRGDDVGSFYDFDQARVRKDFAPQGLGAKTCKEAVAFLGSRKIKSATLPVVLGPLTTHGLFWGICYCAGAENIQRKRSYLVGKRGQQIGSRLLTLRDDGLIPRGMASGARDGEGAVRRKVTVVEQGVLTNLLHGSYTANKAREENTGHGSRWRGVAPTNVVPSLGKATAAEIIADTREGIYVNVGSVMPHPVTGDISATVDFGYKIENGKLAYPLKNTMLGISIFDLLKNLDAVSSDYREEPGTIMPTLRVQNVKVAGAQ